MAHFGWSLFLPCLGLAELNASLHRMGNCLRNNQISAQDENYEPPVEPSEAKVEQIKTSSSSSKLEPARRKESMKKVRFKIQKDVRGGGGSHSNSRSEPMRIRLVVTREELKRILSYNNDAQHTSLEQLLSAMKLRRRSLMSGAGEHDGGINSWRPALESIPEDRSIK